MRSSKKTLMSANNLIEAMRKAGVSAFDVDKFGLIEHAEIVDLIRKGSEYCRIQEHDCNGTKTPRMESRESNIESEIKTIASKYGLRTSFTGDPRGFCVQLHSPKGNVYNTWGGAESGYGI